MHDAQDVQLVQLVQFFEEARDGHIRCLERDSNVFAASKAVEWSLFGLDKLDLYLKGGTNK